MAFRATQRPQPARPQAAVATHNDELQQSLTRAHEQQTLADPQEEWVLFSPVAQSVTQTDTTSTDRTPRTAGLSRLSDFGSLETGAGRSDNLGLGVEHISDHVTDNGLDHDDDADLDSLDDGLHAFQEPSDFGSPRVRIARQSETVLPTHDGMGTFGESSAVQDQLRQYERHGSRRRVKRGSSVTQTLSALREVEERNVEEARVSRIENWRLEQSRALLEEIERETRRLRRMSRSATGRSRASSLNMQTRSETNFSASGYASGYATPTPQQAQSVVVLPPAEEEPPRQESFWKRITRRVIRDLIGIDENLLSVIFGEKLVDETQDLSSSASSLPNSTVQREMDAIMTDADQNQPDFANATWQERLLERLAKELGILVHQLSEHPGAFTTYMRTQEPLSYAGLPNTATLPEDELSATPRPTSFMTSVQNQVADDADPSLWGIEEDSEQADFALNALSEAARLAQEREYWEKDLDINMVFGFLKSRFARGSPSSARPAPSSASQSNDVFGPSLSRPLSNISTLQPSPEELLSPLSTTRRTSNTPAFTAHRAAVIRQHHPLAPAATSAAANNAHHLPNHLNHHHSSSRRRNHSASGSASSPMHQHAGITRRSAGVARTTTSRSSCASQSTKKSKRSGGAGNSSRNYWDLPAGSIGSGNGGPITAGGAWGNVG